MTLKRLKHYWFLPLSWLLFPFRGHGEGAGVCKLHSGKGRYTPEGVTSSLQKYHEHLLPEHLLFFCLHRGLNQKPFSPAWIYIYMYSSHARIYSMVHILLTARLTGTKTNVGCHIISLLEVMKIWWHHLQLKMEKVKYRSVVRKMPLNKAVYKDELLCRIMAHAPHLYFLQTETLPLKCNVRAAAYKTSGGFSPGLD